MPGPRAAMDLEVGDWNSAGVFKPRRIKVNTKFTVSGCGFDAVWDAGAGGGSRFSGAADPTREYMYDVGEDGCIVVGGSSTYTAPADPGWYMITFYYWDTVTPYAEIPLGALRVHVFK